MRTVARAATPEMSAGPDITIKACWDVGDEERALADLDELYEDVWRQIQWTKEQG